MVELTGFEDYEALHLVCMGCGKQDTVPQRKTYTVGAPLKSQAETLGNGWPQPLFCSEQCRLDVLAQDGRQDDG